MGGRVNYAIKDANEVAKYFLTQCALTHKQVHKLLFFAYMEYLKEKNTDVNSLNNQLFPNKFQAWVHGPVYQPIYKYYADYRNSPIEMETYDVTIKNEDVVDFLQRIWEKYKNMSGDDLEELSHNVMAWQKAREGLSFWDISDVSITDKDIFLSEVPKK